MRQRGMMIQEINSIVDGSALAGINLPMMLNPGAALILNNMGNNNMNMMHNPAIPNNGMLPNPLYNPMNNQFPIDATPGFMNNQPATSNSFNPLVTEEIKLN